MIRNKTFIYNYYLLLKLSCFPPSINDNILQYEKKIIFYWYNISANLTWAHRESSVWKVCGVTGWNLTLISIWIWSKDNPSKLSSRLHMPVMDYKPIVTLQTHTSEIFLPFLKNKNHCHYFIWHLKTTALECSTWQ